MAHLTTPVIIQIVTKRSEVITLKCRLVVLVTFQIGGGLFAIKLCTNLTIITGRSSTIPITQSLKNSCKNQLPTSGYVIGDPVVGENRMA